MSYPQVMSRHTRHCPISYAIVQGAAEEAFGLPNPVFHLQSEWTRDYPVTRRELDPDMDKIAWDAVKEKLVAGDGLVVWYQGIEWPGPLQLSWMRAQERMKRGGRRAGQVVTDGAAYVWSLVVLFWLWLMGLLVRRRDRIEYEPMDKVEQGWAK
ncbi:hypothetical protein CspHIS471_0604120 [Cutaneotrichosporon sp. HIS471]|nr:hypothetical protein CspHIS471_0604120 [Cutaneotrichosporon sp. HIS471]